MADFIIQLSILVLVAAGLSIIGRFLKQPPLISYILTGIILGAVGGGLVANKAILDILAEIGIILLLYIAGLEIRIKEFMKIGKHALIVGEGHDVIMAALGMAIGYFVMKLTLLQSFYLGLALTLSSTIVVVKVLTKRKELASPHGRILMGTMLLQDLVAMAALAIFTSLALGGSPYFEIGKTILKAIAMFIVLYFIGKYLVEKLFTKIAENIELVFLLGLAWCFAAVLMAHYIGFSIEIGAFIAGMSIAHLPFAFEIKDKARSLQDFGLLLFFFTIGATVTISKEIFLSMTFALLVLFDILATPLISGAINSFLRFDRKKNFLISVMPTQVSEFSIIIMAIGLKLGQVSEYLFSLIVGITVVTIMLSSGYLNNLNPIYKKVESHLKFLEWRKAETPHKAKTLKHHIVIFGFGKLGEYVSDHYKKKTKVVVEWDPEKIERAKEKGCLMVYASAGDPDVWEEVNIKDAVLVVNTIGANIEDDINLGRWIRKNHPRVVSIAETNVPEEVTMLKEAGYDFVLHQDKAEWLQLKKYLDKASIKKRIKRK